MQAYLHTNENVYTLLVQLMIDFFDMKFDLIRAGVTYSWERSGSVVEWLTRDRGAAGSSLTGVTTLYP